MNNEFVSPLVDGLTKLINSEGYKSLIAIYDAEEKIILRDLANAKDEAELWKLVGRIKELNKLRKLPEETVSKFFKGKGENNEIL